VAALLVLAVLRSGCAGSPGWEPDGDDATDDDTAGDDDATGDDDVQDDDSADDDSGGDDDGPFEVALDLPLTVDGGSLSLTRLDAAAGPDGRIHFTGYDGGSRVYLCSFDGSYEGHLEEEGRPSLDLRTSSPARCTSIRAWRSTTRARSRRCGI
jgi:hypothetical protein